MSDRHIAERLQRNGWLSANRRNAPFRSWMGIKFSGDQSPCRLNGARCSPVGTRLLAAAEIPGFRRNNRDKDLNYAECRTKAG